MAASSYSLYIIRCADNTLYTGITADVSRRFAEHQEGRRGAKYLRGRGPLELVFTADVGDRARALQLEYRVKRLSKSAKCALIAGRESLEGFFPDQVAGEGGS